MEQVQLDKTYKTSRHQYFDLLSHAIFYISHHGINRISVAKYFYRRLIGNTKIISFFIPSHFYRRTHGKTKYKTKNIRIIRNS